MAYNHQDKQSGQLIRAADWNAMSREVADLGLRKIDRAGDIIQGPLKVTGQFSLQDGPAVTAISADPTLGQNRDTALPTEKAVRGYVQAQFAALDTSLTTSSLTVRNKVSVGGAPPAGADSNAALYVKGTIRGTAARPLQRQLVHRRLIYGYAGHGPYQFPVGGGANLGYTIGLDVSAPPLQAGARRAYRMYAVFFLVAYLTKINVTYSYARTDGLPAENPPFIFNVPANRNTVEGGNDAYSNWVVSNTVLINVDHMSFHIAAEPNANVSPNPYGGKLYHLTFETWDLFEDA